MVKKTCFFHILCAGLCLGFFGCAATTPKPAVKPEAEKAAEQKAAEVKQPEKDPCEGKFAELVQKARKTMHTAKDTCGGNKLEANPMWGANYDGTVVVRIYDASGKLVRTEMKKP